MSKLMSRLEKLSDLQKRDREIKLAMQQLNKEIGEFIQNDLGMGEDQGTIVDILKIALESSIEPIIKL